MEQEFSYAAVRLFLHNALRVLPTFSLNEENREWVVRICQLTEGMPLGIELAAAWVRALSCQQIAQEIENSLDFLKAYARDLPERHHSLRAALDHSFDLLSDEEKTVFRRLSVFWGGFRREAAQEVAGASLESLTSLLDKSLLKRVGEERYDLHELVRQYGAFHLQSDPQDDSRTRELHSRYYAAQLERWGEKIASPRQMETLAEMDAETDNVRLAFTLVVLGYMKTRLGEFQEARHNTEESLALNRALGDYDTIVYCLVTLSYSGAEKKTGKGTYGANARINKPIPGKSRPLWMRIESPN